MSANAPAGKIVAYGAAAAPSGWLLCDGASLSRTTYARLFSAIGTTYGSVDSSHFTVPDLRQRFPLGKTATGTGSSLGASGGAIGHTHAATSHTHTVTQPGDHAAHVVGQASSHPSMAHTGFDTTDHGSQPHNPVGVASHSVSVSSSHGYHSTDGAHTHNSHSRVAIGIGGLSGLTSPHTHTSDGGHTHSAHSAHNEAVTNHVTNTVADDHTISAHSVGQSYDHAAQVHSGGALSAHSSHTGAALSAAAAAATSAADAPFTALTYIIADGTTPVPTGAVFPHGAAATPDAYHLVCDGSAVSRTTYADLFAVIGTTFGAGDGSTTFNLPSMTGAQALGLAAAGTGSTLGATGGSAAHAHTVLDHTHPVTQPAAHSAHAVTQPVSHPTLVHSGASVADHTGTGHTGWSLKDHTVTQSSSHGFHSSSGGHQHDAHVWSSFGTGAFQALYGLTDGGAYHTVDGAHTHDTHSAHSGAALSSHAEVQSPAHAGGHSVTQAASHATWTHTGFAVSAHSAHTGTAAAAGGAGSVSTNDTPYMGLQWVIRVASNDGTDDLGHPVGSLWASGRSSPPGTAITCDGRAVSRTAYPDLFSRIGTTFGAGDGSTTFNVPDLRGRIPRGYVATVGETGGQLDHTHTGPSHGHEETQPAAHADHAVTQPSGHGALSHTGAAVATHSWPHSFGCGNHTATQAGNHASHAASTVHNHESHAGDAVFDALGSSRYILYAPYNASHSNNSAHYHNAHSAHAGFGVNAHTLTQPAGHTLAHTVTQPSTHAGVTHTGMTVDAHAAHTGFAVAASGTGAGGTANPPYQVVNYAIQALAEVGSTYALAGGSVFGFTGSVRINGAFGLKGGSVFTFTWSQAAFSVSASPPSSPIIYLVDS